MSKNILITGGAGFIGSNLSLKLINNGYNVTVLDNLSEQIHGNALESPLYKSIKDKVNFIKGDVRSKDDWRIALKGQDIVVHYAAETGTGQSMYEISKYIDVNVGGTANLLDILTNESHQVKKIIVASSRALYGEGRYDCSKHGIVYPNAREVNDMKMGDFNCKCPVCHSNVTLVATDENSKIHPSSIYGITKQNQEQMVLNIGKALGISSIALRYQNVYGPGQSLSNPYTGILSIFSNLIRNNEPINIFEDGKESRDFVYIDDVVEATFQAIEFDQKIYDVFNVGTGIPTSVTEVVSLLISAYKSNIDYKITGNFRIGDIAHNYADNTKIEKTLGFKPKVYFKQGIKLFADWVNQQDIVFNGYKKSIEEMKEKGLFK